MVLSYLLLEVQPLSSINRDSRAYPNNQPTGCRCREPLSLCEKTSRNAWVGLNSKDNCRAENLFIRVTGQTQTLILANELQMMSSISGDKKIEWD